ncbi:hypothetical protein [Methylobacterium marchantiae]|uniref:Uncharacterized protein n=1 Tax=Methylobacterium marchantiae TaxID=600331 RepID=A0ABW3WSZ3_9HYPH
MIAMKNDATRNERLKAALRDNLKRRKAQTRIRGQTVMEISEQAAGGAEKERKPQGEGDGDG